MDLILRVASRFLDARDAFDTQLAISQILRRSGWSEGVNGKLIKKVKMPYQAMPKIYILEPLRDGDLMVRDDRGKVHTKVDISTVDSPAEILNAAKKLNDGAAAVALR